MNCDKTLELLSAELDGRLSETEHAELQAHLDKCADCRRVYGTLRDVDARVREMGRLVGYGCDLALHRGLSLAEIPTFLS